MARPRKVATTDGGADEAPPKFVRVKITHYKVTTSQGRGLQDHYMELPEEEARDLEEIGWAKIV